MQNMDKCIIRLCINVVYNTERLDHSNVKYINHDACNSSILLRQKPPCSHSFTVIPDFSLNKGWMIIGTSQGAVQWFRHCSSTAGGASLTPDWETRKLGSHMPSLATKNKKIKDDYWVNQQWDPNHRLVINSLSLTKKPSQRSWW